MNSYARFETKEIAKKLNSSNIEDYKLDKNYSNMYLVAKDLLVKKGVKTPTKEQINDTANELVMLNGNSKLKNGSQSRLS